MCACFCGFKFHCCWEGGSVDEIGVDNLSYSTWLIKMASGNIYFTFSNKSYTVRACTDVLTWYPFFLPHSIASLRTEVSSVPMKITGLLLDPTLLLPPFPFPFLFVSPSSLGFMLMFMFMSVLMLIFIFVPRKSDLFMYPPSQRSSAASENRENGGNFISFDLSALRTYIAMHCPLFSLGMELIWSFDSLIGRVRYLSSSFNVGAFGLKKKEAETARHQ